MKFDNPIVRKSMVVMSGLMVVGLISYILPLPFDEPSLKESGRRDFFYRVRAAFAQGVGEYDTLADEVYGQLTLTDTVVAGTPAAETLMAPADVFVYDSGQIFIADTENNRILGWNSVDSYQNGDPADLVLGQPDFTSNDAPNPPTASSLNHPSALLIDFYGQLYVSDSNNNRVLIYTPVIDGNGLLTFTHGQAADMVIGQPNFTSNDAPPPNTKSMNHPMGITVDFHDNLVVADRDNNRVLIFEPPLETGMEVSRLIGQVSPDGLSASATSKVVLDPPTAASLNRPSGVAIGAVANELYIADTGNNRVLIYNDEFPLNGTADVVIGQPNFTSKTANNGGVSATSLNSPTGLKLDSADRLLVADTANNRVLVYVDALLDQTADMLFGQPDFTSNTANNGGVSGSSLNAPTGMATDQFFMDIYIADPGNQRVLRYYQPLQNPHPKIQELAPGTIRAGSNGFTLEVWATGIISDTTVQVNGQTRQPSADYFGLLEIPISAAEVATGGTITVTLTNPAPGGGISDPFTLAVYAPQDDDTAPDSVMGQTGFTTYDGAFIPTQADNLFEPRGLVIDKTSGRIFVADSGNSRVVSWSSQNAMNSGAAADLVIGQPDFESFFSESVTANSLNTPAGLALDSAGNLYVSDPVDNRVLIFKAPLSNGMAATVVIGQPDFTSDVIPFLPQANTVNSPIGLAIDSIGNLYVADAENNRVLIYRHPITEDTTADMVLGQKGSFTNGAANQGGLSAASLSFPSGVALDGLDNLYVADQGNNRVLRYDNPLTHDDTADQIFGGTPARQNSTSLSKPSSVAVDSANNLYVADRGNNQVLFYFNPLTADTVADNSFKTLGNLVPNTNRTKNLSEPYSMAVDKQGNLFIADTNHNRVLGYLNPQAKQITPTPMPTNTPAITMTATSTPVITTTATITAPTSTPVITTTATITAPTSTPVITTTATITAPTSTPVITTTATITAPTSTPAVTKTPPSGMKVYIPVIVRK